METILCATDFSDNAKKAADWAAFLSAELKVPLYLYNCYHIPVIINDMPFQASGLSDIEDGLNPLMKAEASRLNELYPKLEIKTKVEPGFANERILRYAKKHHAKLIIMGITGRNAAGQFFLGSTAVSVSLNSPIPVLIVPAQTKSMKITNIALAYDLNGTEKIGDIDLFHKLVQLFDANVDLVHVSKNGNGARTQADLAGMIPKIEKYKHALHNVEDNSVEPALLHFTEKNKTDVLTMVHKNHGFFERHFKRSHTGKLAYQINIPLLVLHEMT